MAIVKWINPEYGARKLVIDFTPGRDAITLRAAKSDDPAEAQFDPTTELADLWETLKKSGHNVSATNLILFSDQIDSETGKGSPVEAKIRNQKKPEFGYAYTPDQLAKFEPKHFFVGANLKMHGQPWFSCSMLAYVPRARVSKRQAAPKPTVVRMTAPAPAVTRQRAKA